MRFVFSNVCMLGGNGFFVRLISVCWVGVCVVIVCVYCCIV